MLRPTYVPYLVIFIFSFFQYSNSLYNEYALDDEMVMHHNIYVHQGISGIPEIISKDSYQGYFDKHNANSPLAGGRYRPLSIVTFAVEQQLFSSIHGEKYMNLKKELEQAKAGRADQKQLNDLTREVTELNTSMLNDTFGLAGIRHVTQLIFFALSMMVVFHFLNTHIFKNVVPSIICVGLFIVHPVHSEVVANIKSRDEIFSLMFICLSLDMAFRWNEHRRGRFFCAALTFFVLALLSKEYAVAVPILFVAGLYLLKDVSFKNTFSSLTMVMIVVDLIFLFIRNSIIHQKKIIIRDEVLNNPYLFASPLESFCSRISLMVEYLRLLFFPVHLSADYSYQHIPYSDLSDFRFWFSLAVYITLTGVTGYLIWKRSKYAFPLLFILIFLFMINNLLVPIGATLGERLLYHSSLGVCILVTFGIWNLSEKYAGSKKAVIAVVAATLLMIPLSVRTFVRNPDWKNDYTLFHHDVEVVPNSALVNANVGSSIFNKANKELAAIQNPDAKDSAYHRAQIKESMKYLNRSIQLHPTHVNSLANLGLAWFNLGQIDSAARYWVKAAGVFEGVNPMLQVHARSFYDLGMLAGRDKNYSKAVYYLDIASRLDPDDPAIWENLGGACFMNGKFAAAANAFQNSLNINPDQPKTQSGKAVAENFVRLQKKVQENPADQEAKKELITNLENNGFTELAKKYK